MAGKYSIAEGREDGKEIGRMELSHKNNYKFQAEKGSKVELEIEAKIKEVSSADLQEILHEVASCTHNFYLNLGRKISEL